MRRLLLLPPLAALATGCAEESSLPSPVMPEGWTETELVGRGVSRDDALRRWYVAADAAWSPYAKYALFTALDHTPLPSAGPGEGVARAAAAARALARDGLPPDVMWVVDLPGEDSVAFGTTLSQSAREPVSVVPTFNNWPARNELVPAQATMGALATMAPKPVDPTQGPSRPVFLLDSWRLAYRDDEPAEGVYDNRYALSPVDFPDASVLLARGIGRVVYVVPSRQRTRAEEEDLYTTFLAYTHAGVAVAVVDLADLLGEPQGQAVAVDEGDPREPWWDWDRLFLEQRLQVVPRVTILEGPAFYRRAHGAFGGIRAAPHIGAWGAGVAHAFGGGGHGFGRGGGG